MVDLICFVPDIYGLVVVMHFYIFSGVGLSFHASEVHTKFLLVFTSHHATIHPDRHAEERTAVPDKPPTVSSWSDYGKTSDHLPPFILALCLL